MCSPARRRRGPGSDAATDRRRRLDVAGGSLGRLRLAADPGPPGTGSTLTVLRAGTGGACRSRARTSSSRSRAALIHYHGLKLGYLRFTSFADGSGASCDARSRRCSSRGAGADPRSAGERRRAAQRGGERRRASSSPTARSSRPPVAASRVRCTSRRAERSPTKIPLVVLVDRDTASAAEIVTGALQDRHRALVVGTHTYGKGVFQEIQPLSNGGALDITVGEYFTPSGRNLGGGGRPRGRGDHAERLRDRQPRARGSTRRCRSPSARSPPRSGERAVRAAAAALGARRACSSGAGKFLVAEPFFERRPAVRGQPRPNARDVGDLVVGPPPGRRPGGRGGAAARAAIARRIGRPESRAT